MDITLRPQSWRYFARIEYRQLMNKSSKLHYLFNFWNLCQILSVILTLLYSVFHVVDVKRAFTSDDDEEVSAILSSHWACVPCDHRQLFLLLERDQESIMDSLCSGRVDSENGCVLGHSPLDFRSSCVSTDWGRWSIRYEGCCSCLHRNLCSRSVRCLQIWCGG